MDVSIQDQVIADLEARKELGFSKYGTLLYAKNGRSFAQDLYEELLDAACYLKGMILEADGPSNQYLDLGDLWDCVPGTVVERSDKYGKTQYRRVDEDAWLQIDPATGEQISTIKYYSLSLIKASQKISLVEAP